MHKRYKVIMLCGSTKFKSAFEEMNKKLTLEGNVVISVACFGHAGDSFTDNQKIMLDDIHKQKIEMADEIFVINESNYIGESTLNEIKYALCLGKPITYMNELSLQKFNSSEYPKGTEFIMDDDAPIRFVKLPTNK